MLKYQLFKHAIEWSQPFFQAFQNYICKFLATHSTLFLFDHIVLRALQVNIYELSPFQKHV